MKPTVIGSKNASRAVGPTVIPSTPPHAHPAPTVIGGQGDGSRGPSPTVMPSTMPAAPHAPAKTVTTIPSSPLPDPKPEAPPVTGRPKVIGTVRKRIEVDPAALRSQNPAAKDGVIEEAARLIRMTSVEGSNDRLAIMWGHDIQLSYGKLVSECLALSQTEALSKVSGHVNRMLAILESIDVRGVCGLDGDGALSRLVKRATKRVDSADELKRAQAELSQIIKLLEKRLDALLELKDKLDRVSGEIDRIGDQIEAHAIAAAFIADYVGKEEQPVSELSPRFSERSMSLTQTLEQIRSSRSMREIQIERPLQLITTVQQVALIMVPALIGSIAAIAAMLGGNGKPTETDADEVGDQIGKVIAELKKT